MADIAVDLAVGVLSGLITTLIDSYSKKLEQATDSTLPDYATKRSTPQQLTDKITAACRRLPESELNFLSKYLGDEQIVSELSGLAVGGAFDAEEVRHVLASSALSTDVSVELLKKAATSLQNAFDECIAKEDFESHYSMLRQLRALRAQNTKVDATTQEIKNAIDKAVVPELKQIGASVEQLREITKQIVHQSSPNTPSTSGTLIYGNSLPFSLEELSERLASQYKARLDAATEALKNSRLTDALNAFTSIYREVEHLNDPPSQRARFRAANGVALCNWHSSKTGDAIEWFKKAISHGGGEDKTIRRNNMLVRFLEGDAPNATILAEALLLDFPHFYDAASILANIATQRGEPEEALQCLRKHSDGTLDFSLALARQNLSLEHFAEALQYAEAACKSAPQSWDARIALIDAKTIPIVQKRNQIQSDNALSPDDISVLNEAIEVYSSLLSSDCAPQSFEVRERVVTNFSSFASLVGQFDNAKAELTKFLNEYPQSIPTLQNLFIVLARTRDWDSAIQTAEVLLNLAPSEEGAIRLLEVIGHANRSSEAIARHEQLATLYPRLKQSGRTLTIIGKCFYDVGETLKAFEALNAACIADPPWLLAFLVRGACLEKEGRDTDAESDFKRALAEESEAWRWLAQYEYGMFLARHNKWAEAVHYFELCGGKDSRTSILPEYLVALSQLGKWKECIEILDKRADPIEYNEALVDLEAHCRLRMFDYKGAEACFRQLTDRDGQRVQHWANLANVLYNLDRIDSAVATLRKAISLNPNAAELWLNISRMYLLRAKRKEAVDAAMKAAQIAPNSEAVHNWIFNLGQLAIRGSDLPESFVPLLQKTMTFLLKDPKSGFTQIESKKCIKQVKRSLKQLRRSVKRTAQIFNTTPTPIHLLRNPLGRSLFELWLLAVGGVEDMKVRMSRGGLADQESELSLVKKQEEVVLEMTGLLSLGLTQKLDLLPKLFKKVLIPTTVFDELKHASEHLIFETNTHGVFALEEGKPVFIEQSSAIVENRKALLERIVEFCKSSSVELVPLPVFALDNPAFESRAQVLGLQATHAGMVASVRKAVLYSDDWLYRSLFFNEELVRGTCTQAVLRAAGLAGYLDLSSYEGATLLLISSNYAFVADDVGTLMALIENKFEPGDKICQMLLGRIARNEVDRFPAMSFLGQFVGLIRRKCRGQEQEKWIKAAIDAFSNAEPSDTDTCHFCLGLIMSLSSTPALHFDILVKVQQKKWTNPRLIRAFDYFTYLFVRQCPAYASSVGFQLFPQDWRHHWKIYRKLLKILRS